MAGLRWTALGSLLLLGCSSGPGDSPDAQVGPDGGVDLDAPPGPTPDLFLDIETVRIAGEVVAGTGVTDWCGTGSMLTFSRPGGDQGHFGVPSCAGDRASFAGTVPRGVDAGRWLSYTANRVEGPLDAFAPVDADRTGLALGFSQRSYSVSGRLLFQGAPFPLDCAAPAFELQAIPGIPVPMTCDASGGPPRFALRLPQGSYRFQVVNRGQFADAPFSWSLGAVVTVQADIPDLAVDVQLWPVAGMLVESGAAALCPGPTTVRWAGERAFSLPVSCGAGGPTFSGRLPPGQYQVAVVASDLVAPATTVDLTAAQPAMSISVPWIDLQVQVSGIDLGGGCAVVLEDAGNQPAGRLTGSCATGSFARRIIAGRYERVVLEGSRGRVTLATAVSITTSTTLPFDVATVRLTGSFAGDKAGSAWLGCLRAGQERPKSWDLSLTDTTDGHALRFEIFCDTVAATSFALDVPQGSYSISLGVPNWRTIQVPGLIDATTGPVTWSYTARFRSALLAVRRNGVLGAPACDARAMLHLLPAGRTSWTEEVAVQPVGCSPGQTGPLAFELPTVLAADYEATLLLQSDDGNGESVFVRRLVVP